MCGMRDRVGWFGVEVLISWRKERASDEARFVLVPCTQVLHVLEIALASITPHSSLLLIPKPFGTFHCTDSRYA
jgi:hypothetical protein